MQDCPVCDRRFDPSAFQVVVPELGRGFDRIECARSARALAWPESRIAAAAPLVAIVEPITAALAPGPVSGSALRPFGASVAALGLLAAGTAVAVVLWLRVLGADTTGFPFSRAAAPPAFGHETVQTQVQPASGSQVGKAPGRPAAEQVAPLIAASRISGSTSPAARSTGTPAIVARPEPPSPVGSRTPTDDETGKGHAKLGKGHIKHGEGDGVHSPGHGHHGGKGKHG
ncbi:MAG TPA: hypothetical protein VGJ27_04140 [Gaiellaceae bacterium]|jgi:hypothetical protein